MTAYYTRRPDGVGAPATGDLRHPWGHRGSAFDCAFNEGHILATAPAIVVAMAIFGLGLSLPLVLVVFWGGARNAVDRPAGASERMPLWTGIAFVMLGAWLIYFGFRARRISVSCRRKRSVAASGSKWSADARSTIEQIWPSSPGVPNSALRSINIANLRKLLPLRTDHGSPAMHVSAGKYPCRVCGGE